MIISEVTNINLSKEAALINKECAAYLDSINNKVLTYALFRGTNKDNKPKSRFTKVECPTNRRPTSTKEYVHLLSDTWFKDHFGYNFRSNSVFTTGNPSQARGYGYLCAVFPIGEFHICYSPVIHDLYDEWAEFDDTYNRPLSEKDVNTILQAGKYRSGPLTLAISANHEIMLHCKNYYLLKVGDNYKSILTRLQEEINKLRNTDSLLSV